MSYARKKPYISADYEEMRATRMDSEIFNPNSPQRVESEFKKPYLFDEHPKSEQTYTPPGLGPLPPGVFPPYVPPYIPGSGGGGGGDCTPGGDAIGGGPNLCEPGQDCGQWVFSCAHKITSFTAIGGHIAGISFGSNDTVTVTACWDPDYKQIVISGWLDNGKAVTAGFDKSLCGGDGADPECPDCDTCAAANKGPSLLYTTQQMSTNGIQYLKATGGGGGPYTWSITSIGGNPGTLSTTETVNMAYNLYTAPSSNTNCTDNPTIKVTDKCGNYTTLKLAINDYTGGEVAYTANSPLSCVCALNGEPVCDGNINTIALYYHSCCHPQYNCDNTFHSWAAHAGMYSNTEGFSCASYGAAYCAANCTTWAGGADKRSTAMKTAGCCPVGLIT